jgi:hypothetical protein
MSIKPGPWLIILSFSMLGPAFLFAQKPHAHAKVYPPEMQMTSSPLRDIELLPDVGDLLEGIENPQRDYISGYGSEDIVKPGTQNRFDRTGGSDKVQTVNGLNFDGMGVSGRWPTPDANGAVGSTEFVQAVNAMFAVYDKSTGALLYGPVGFAKPWKALSGLCGTTGEGDPVVQYDKAAERWVFTKHAYNTGGPYYECVAVSTTPDALGSYNLYAYQLPNLFPDYPKLAVWPDAYYLSIDQQDPRNGYAYAGVLVCALDRVSMLAGAPADAQCFQLSPNLGHSLLPSDLDGSTPPPPGSPNYFMNLTANALNVWQFHVDWAVPSNSTFTGPVTLPVTHFSEACNGGICVPQLGTANTVDALGDRLMYRLAYRNFGGHESLVVNHSVTTSSGNVGVRWYEIRNPGGNPPSMYQQATFAPDSNWRWMGSVAMDSAGDIALGYSVSSTSMVPAVRYTGRLSSDAVNTMENETSIIEGQGTEEADRRWGDYTAMTTDPVDDCTFWYTNEYYQSSGKNWNTRIASFKFPTCNSIQQPVSFSQTSVIFPPELVGTTSSPQSVTLTNNQTVSLNISSITTTGDYEQSNNCGTSLPPSGSCTVTVSFTPIAMGTRTGSLLVTDDAENSPQNVSLSGIGIAPIVKLSAASLTFPSTILGTISVAKEVIVSNAGTAALKINTVFSSGNFSEADNCAGAFIPPSSSCTVRVRFKPSVSGTISGAVTITDAASNSPQIVNLKGTAVDPVTLTPASLGFGSVAVGQISAPKTVTVSNNQSTSLNFTYSVSGNYQVTASGKNPCSAILPKLSQCTVSVKFSPNSDGLIRGAFTVTHDASFSPQSTNLSGTGLSGSSVPLTFSPASVIFGNVVVGTTSARAKVTVRNTSNTTVNVTGIAASGNYAVTGAKSAPCGGPLGAGATCGILVTYGPTVPGNNAGAVTIDDDSGVSPQTFNLIGTGILPVTLSPGSLVFPAQSVGSTSPLQIVTLTNNQNVSLTISSVVASGNYLIATAGNAPCASTLAAEQSCTVGVEFSPTASGTIKGVVTVSHDAAYSPQEVTLSGTAN